MFSNNNQLAERINKVSYIDNVVPLRLPLNKNFDKLIDSQIADVQNINYSGGAGSITAAQFLQRFILNKTPWAHLDIAGMALGQVTKTIPVGATGYGVKLLIDWWKSTMSEKTLSLIKPDAVERNLIGKIIQIFEDNNLIIEQMKKVYIDIKFAKKFYSIHSTKPFFDDLCNYISSGPLVAIVLKGENAIQKNRDPWVLLILKKPNLELFVICMQFQ